MKPRLNIYIVEVERDFINLYNHIYIKMNRVFRCLLALMLFCVACQNDGIVDDNSGRFPVCVDGKWGYIDTTGAIVIKPQFDEAKRFSEELAIVRDGGKYGYIDKRGKYIIKPQFEAAGRFSEGVASVKRLSDGKAGRCFFTKISGRSYYADVEPPLPRISGACFFPQRIIG